MRRLFVASVAAAAALAPLRLTAQLIRFDAELPRVFVLFDEGSGDLASTQLQAFLVDAGFSVADARVAAALPRPPGASTTALEQTALTLGRRLGAHVALFGRLEADAAPSPADPALQTGSASLSLRAVRLDGARVAAAVSTAGRGLAATPLGARAAATRQAVAALLRDTRFMGDLVTDWQRVAWDDAAYWRDVEPSARPGAGGDGGLVLLEAAVERLGGAGAQRGIGAAKFHARVRGAVAGDVVSVRAGDRDFVPRPPTPHEQESLGVAANARLIEAGVPVSSPADTLRLTVQAAADASEVSIVPAGGRRWAVVIGISRYRDARIPTLSYADADARAFHEYLRSPSGGGVPAERIRLLLNEAATAEALRDALFVFLQQADPDDEVVVYVAAHGAPDPARRSNLYLLAYDTEVDRFAATAFPMWDFKTAAVRQIRAERVVVLADACRSAGVAIAGGEASNAIGAAFGEVFSGARRLTLAASGADEVSVEGAQWGGGHGVFTHYLLEGLGGAADIDGDGVVKFSEVARYVSARVPAGTGDRQHPRRAGTGDLALGRTDPAGS